MLFGVVALFLDRSMFLGAGVAAAVYTFIYFARALRAASGRIQTGSRPLGLAFMAAFIWLSDRLNVIPDVWTPAEAQAAPPGDASDDAEAILFGQAAQIDERSPPWGDSAHTPTPKAYFLGFAGRRGREGIRPGSRPGLQSTRRTVRHGYPPRVADQRSADLERAPLATVSGLKYALHGLSERMDVDRDVLFLSISSHGASDPAIAVSNSQLPLSDLTDEALADALSESGIKWRVIIISACYAGGFIDALRDPQTIVITAAASDRTSFGCSNDRDLTYFGEAFLPRRPTLRAHPARGLRTRPRRRSAPANARNTSRPRTHRPFSAKKWRKSWLHSKQAVRPRGETLSVAERGSAQRDNSINELQLRLGSNSDGSARDERQPIRQQSLELPDERGSMPRAPTWIESKPLRNSFILIGFWTSAAAPGT